MFPFKEFMGLLAQVFAMSLMSPLLWAIMLLIGWRYYRVSESRNILIGKDSRRDWRGIFLAVLLGLAGGWLGSLLMGFSGLTINELNIPALWVAAFLLMLIHPRFLCFAYGGSIIILLTLLTGWPGVNGPMLLALIGCLHLVESLLITVAGPSGALPIWMQHPKTHEWVVGFRMEHFWPLPLMLFWGVNISIGTSVAGAVATPNWWPLFPLHQSLGAGEDWLYVLMPVVAALGYADFAVTCSPEKKSRRSGFGLFVYSVILLVLAWLSVHYWWVLIPAALFSALGHEGLIRLEAWREWRGKPILRARFDEFFVLMVAPDSLAERMGIEPGDQITRLSGYEIHSSTELKEAMFWSPSEFTLEWIRQGELKTGSGKFQAPGAQRSLGVLPLVQGLPIPFATNESMSIGARLWRTIKNEVSGRK